MKKCESCGSSTKNKTYEGDQNKYNQNNCQRCAQILQHVDMFEMVLNEPNLSGSKRNVKLSVKITK